MIHHISAKTLKHFLSGRKSNIKFQNQGFFEKQKSKSQLVGGTFFETVGELKCPSKPYSDVCKPDI